MTRDITATPEYRQVFAWLRGGDTTLDPQMENSFLDLITAAVAQRLTAEHPQMWQYGPVFPRAYNRLRKEADDGSPWADTRKSYPDSWGARIEDDLIREWFLPRV